MTPDLLLIGLSLLTWGLGEGAFFIFQPIYLQELGADPVQIGMILGASGVAMSVARIPAGYLADRIGRKPLLVAAWLMGLFSLNSGVRSVRLDIVNGYVEPCLKQFLTNGFQKQGHCGLKTQEAITWSSTATARSSVLFLNTMASSITKRRSSFTASRLYL